MLFACFIYAYVTIPCSVINLVPGNVSDSGLDWTGLLRQFVKAARHDSYQNHITNDLTGCVSGRLGIKSIRLPTERVKVPKGKESLNEVHVSPLTTLNERMLNEG